MPPFHEKEVYHKMTETLGSGPMRFGPVRRPLNVKEMLLQQSSNLQAFIRIKVATEQHGLDKMFTQEQILRVALYHEFDVEKTVRLLRHMDVRYWNVSVAQLEEQLKTQTLFPLPHKLTSKDKKIKSFFYMKPSRFLPHDTSTSCIIANLLYVMDSLDHFADGPHRNKIGFIANMTDWTMENFSIDYCLKFMECLQGKKGPVNVDLFLIVNPPSWFDKVWQTMKPMLNTGFRRKVHMIPETKLKQFLAPGYEKYLPQELGQGRVDVSDLVRDFIRYRSFVETKVFPHERLPTKETRRLVRVKRQQQQREEALSSSRRTSLSSHSHRRSGLSRQGSLPTILVDGKVSTSEEVEGSHTMEGLID